MKKKINIGAIIFYLVIIAILIASIISIFNGYGKARTCTYSELIEHLENNEVYDWQFNENNYKITIKIKDENGKDVYVSCKLSTREADFFFSPSDKDHADYHRIKNEWSSRSDWNLKGNEEIKIVAYKNFNWSTLLSFLPTLLMFAGIVVFVIFIMRQSKKDGMGGFGKSKAKVYMEKQTGVTFKDVAGQDEAKESLQEIIDFLHNPKKYTDIGAKLPKGALLVGSPGTGKTLLAKAVAGEANVPFFSFSGSDFVEMFVGVGASRVRNHFQQAAKVAPCIIFIDEIDAIGRARGKNPSFNQNDERESTLNQLLTEMDGFGNNSGVIILAATNRVEILDEALLRAGCFDRQIRA